MEDRHIWLPTPPAGPTTIQSNDLSYLYNAQRVPCEILSDLLIVQWLQRSCYATLFD